MFASSQLLISSKPILVFACTNKHTYRQTKTIPAKLSIQLVCAVCPLWGV